MIMKIVWCAMILISIIAVTGLCQTDKRVTNGNSGMSMQKTLEECQTNPDILYYRTRVLEQLADVLNGSAPGFRKYEGRGFYVEKDRAQGFFIFDLTDPSNKDIPSSSCVNFLNNHIYHFAARYTPFSLSHVAV